MVQQPTALNPKEMDELFERNTQNAEESPISRVEVVKSSRMSEDVILVNSAHTHNAPHIIYLTPEQQIPRPSGLSVLVLWCVHVLSNVQEHCNHVENSSGTCYFSYIVQPRRGRFLQTQVPQSTCMLFEINSPCVPPLRSVIAYSSILPPSLLGRISYV